MQGQGNAANELPMNQVALENEFDKFMKRERLSIKFAPTEKKSPIDKPVYKRTNSRIGMGLNRLNQTGSSGQALRPESKQQSESSYQQSNSIV